MQKLEAEGCGIRENYETFSHVSIRRLGRLLPDARWVSSLSVWLFISSLLHALVKVVRVLISDIV